MEREEIVREEFPTTRKGWSPEAVRAHLESLADRLPTSSSAVGEVAAGRVNEIVSAAEGVAAQIEADASERAEELLSEARAEAERIVAEARSEAEARIEQAQGAVESLVSQAEDLRRRVGTLGEALAGELREKFSDVKAEITPPSDPAPPSPDPAPPVPTPDPDPPVPTPDPEPPVPTPDPDPPVPEPEPGPPDPSPEPGPREPEPDPEPPAPDPPQPDPDEPVPAPPAPDPEPARNGAAAERSTEDLIAELRGAEVEPASGEQSARIAAEVAEEADERAGGTEEDLGAARLVAMNLALEGAERERIASELESDFGELDGAEALIDDVLARVGRG